MSCENSKIDEPLFCGGKVATWDELVGPAHFVTWSSNGKGDGTSSRLFRAKERQRHLPIPDDVRTTEKIRYHSLLSSKNSDEHNPKKDEETTSSSPCNEIQLEYWSLPPPVPPVSRHVVFKNEKTVLPHFETMMKKAAVVTTARPTEHENHNNIYDTSSSSHLPASSMKAVASVAGCLFLVCCASITTYCAILSELQGWEPSLRGLVHAGVMLLFAGICIEPLLFGGSNSSSQTQTQPNDAHGMGIVFAALGMFFVGSVGVSTLLLSSSESTESSAENHHAFFVAVAAGIIASTILLRVIFLPVMNDNDMSSHAYRSQGLALGCFTLGSMLSLLDTWQIVLTELYTAPENSPPWMVLLLDLMAYVFHRAFIGSILVGGGFGSSSENDDPTLDRPRQLLRCRYRAFFFLVGMNLSLSWFLCGQYVSSVLVLISALLQWKEGVLFCQRLHPHEIRRWKRGDDTLVSPSTSTCSARSRPRGIAHHWLQFVLLGGHRFSSTAFIAANLAFAFYAATLFADGVLLHNNNNIHNSKNIILGGGLDACLVKAVHVAAVWAAMMAIFPRLLLVVASGSVSFHRVVKGVCALMSTVDVTICLGILFFTSKTEDDSSSSSSSRIRVCILWARILGATLQSLAFGTLQVQPSLSVTDNTSIELTSLTTNEGEVDISLTDDSRRTIEPPQVLEDDTTKEVGGETTESSTYLQYYENVDAFAVWTWIVYFGTHVVHSCVWSNPTTFSLIATELQLSKIFHFQVITIGFYSSGIFRRDIMSWTIVSVFATLEMAGILVCHFQEEQQQEQVLFLSSNHQSRLSWDRMGMVMASMLLLCDCVVRLLFRHHNNDGWIETGRAKKKDDGRGVEGAGAVLFPS